LSFAQWGAPARLMVAAVLVVGIWLAVWGLL
jgi:hypothetical protein